MCFGTFLVLRLRFGLVTVLPLLGLAAGVCAELDRLDLGAALAVLGSVVSIALFDAPALLVDFLRRVEAARIGERREVPARAFTMPGDRLRRLEAARIGER